jgi:hypothetical protein
VFQRCLGMMHFNLSIGKLSGSRQVGELEYCLVFFFFFFLKGLSWSRDGGSRLPGAGPGRLPAGQEPIRELADRPFYGGPPPYPPPGQPPMPGPPQGIMGTSGPPEYSHGY